DGRWCDRKSWTARSMKSYMRFAVSAGRLFSTLSCLRCRSCGIFPTERARPLRKRFCRDCSPSGRGSRVGHEIHLGCDSIDEGLAVGTFSIQIEVGAAFAISELGVSAKCLQDGVELVGRSVEIKSVRGADVAM